MTEFFKALAHQLYSGLFALAIALLPVAAQADSHQEGGARAMALTMEAVVTDIDLETRQITLEGPTGNFVTMAAQENVVKLEDIKVGDKLVATYIAALEVELREPTEDELAEPWVVLEEGGVSGEGEDPAMAGGRVIRAICTIEGLNRSLGAVTIKDPRGKLHVIGDVEPEKMDGVTLGQTVVVVYAEALALQLEHQQAATD